LLAANLADYLIPTATDYPKIRAIALENHRSPSNPLGVKGAGEGAIIPIGGLMANAVTSFGAMPNQLPLSPARVWHMSSAKTNARNRGTPLRPRRPVRATGREKRGDDQIHRARVLEARIHSPPAERCYGAGGEKMAISSLTSIDGVPRCPSQTI